MLPARYLPPLCPARVLPVISVPRPVKHMYSGRMPTLCLAIKASDWDHLRIPGSVVLCMDSLGSNDFTSTERVRKIEWLPHGFIALVAGPISTARELADIVRDQMQAGVSGVAPLLQQIRTAVSVMKHRFADAHVGARLGMDYRKFQRTGRQALPDDLYRQIAWDISGQRLEVELIVAGFVPGQYSDREPVVVKLSAEQVVTCDTFAAIGSGALLAEASLMQRDYSSIATIEYATYLAYEAKRLGERAPGVGRETNIMVMVDGPNGPRYKELFRDQLSTTLENLFKRFGPQPITDTKVMQLPQNAWHPEAGSDHQWTTVAPSDPPPSQA